MVNASHAVLVGWTLSIEIWDLLNGVEPLSMFLVAFLSGQIALNMTEMNMLQNWLCFETFKKGNYQVYGLLSQSMNVREYQCKLYGGQNSVDHYKSSSVREIQAINTG